MATIWRDPVRMTFIDADNNELGTVERPDFVPRTGENVRLRDVPYVVERIGWDYPEAGLDRIWVVCRRV